MKHLFISFLLGLISIPVSGITQQNLHSHIKYDTISCPNLKIDNPILKKFLYSVVDTVKAKGYTPEIIAFTLLVEPSDNNSLDLVLTFKKSSDIGYTNLVSLRQFREHLFVKQGEGENLGICIVDNYIFIVNGRMEALKDKFSYLAGDFKLLVSNAADGEPYWYAWWTAAIKNNRLKIIKYDPPFPYPFNQTQ